MEQGRQEQLRWVKCPTCAARIQGLAAPNTLAVSVATYRLIQGYFACQDLGAQTLRGVAEPITVYRVLSESGAHSRLDIASAQWTDTFGGREQEVGILLERWDKSKLGMDRSCYSRVMQALGRSRLVQMLKDHVVEEPHVRWECRSSEYAQNTALFPLVDLFQRLLQVSSRGYP